MTNDIKKLVESSVQAMTNDFWQSVALQEGPFDAMSRAGNKALASLPFGGSKSARGRYNVQRLAKQLYDGWNEFRGASGARKTWQSLADYLTNHVGFATTVEALQGYMSPGVNTTSSNGAAPPQQNTSMTSPSSDPHYSERMSSEPNGGGYNQSNPGKPGTSRRSRNLNNSYAPESRLLPEALSARDQTFGLRRTTQTYNAPSAIPQPVYKSATKMAYTAPGLTPAILNKLGAPPTKTSVPVRQISSSPLPAQMATLTAFGVPQADIMRMTRAEAEQYIINKAKNTKGAIARTESAAPKSPLVEAPGEMSRGQIKQVLLKVAQQAFQQNRVRRGGTGADDGHGSGMKGGIGGSGFGGNITDKGNTVSASKFTELLKRAGVAEKTISNLTNMAKNTTAAGFTNQLRDDQNLSKQALMVAFAALLSVEHLR